MNGRHHHQVPLQPKTCQDHCGKKTENPRRHLGLATDESREGNDETEDEGQNGQAAPRGLGTVDDPGLLPGELAVPDDQVLGEEEVRPEDGKGEGELPQVVQLLHTHELVEVRIPSLGVNRGPCRRRHPSPKGPHKEPGTKDGGVPMWLQGHDPVESHDAHHHREKKNGHGGDPVQPPIAPNLFLLLTPPTLGKPLRPPGPARVVAHSLSALH